MVDAKTGALGQVGIAITFGLVLMAMIHAVGHISGAHPTVDSELGGLVSVPVLCAGVGSIRPLTLRQPGSVQCMRVSRLADRRVLTLAAALSSGSRAEFVPVSPSRGVVAGGRLGND